MAEEKIDVNTEGDLLEEDVAAAPSEDETPPDTSEMSLDTESAGDEDAVDSSIEEVAGDDAASDDVASDDVTSDEESANDDDSFAAIDASIDAEEAPESDDNQTTDDDAEEEDDDPPPATSSGIELTEEELAALDAEIAAQLDAEAEQDAASDEWYFVHTYSGMENKVKKNLEHRIESMGMSDLILQVVVPTETEVEIRKGVRKEVEKRVFPGYILVNMVVDEDSWYVVRNTPGVTGFVGMGNKPTPLSPDEVSRIMERLDADEPIVKVSFALGEHVRITGGPFAEFGGIVEEIYADKGKAKVMVSFFNRETPVEVDFVQLEKEEV